MTTKNHLERPRLYDVKVTELTVERLLPKVNAYLKSGGWSDSEIEHESERTRTDLQSAIDFQDDAYQICRNLEDYCYWEVDSELVDLMEDVFRLRYVAHHEVMMQWLKENPVPMTVSVGDRVKYVYNGKEVEGEVTKINYDLAMCTVCFESLGHVKSGIGTHGLHLNIEDLTKVA